MIDPPRLGKESPLGLMLEDARSDRLDAEGRSRAWRSIEAAAATGVVSAAVVKSGVMSKLAAFAISKIGIATMCAAAVVAAGAVFLSTRATTTTSSIAAPVATTTENANVATQATPAIETAPVETMIAPAPTARSTQRPTASSIAPAPHVDAVPTLAEGRLLLDAKAAIASNPTRSLELTTTHQTTFPTSPLAAERESIAIDALSHLGRCAEAHTRATQFRAKFPTSPHLALVDRAEAGCK